tara:strand:+ start:5081 stop:5701 length:621 start_codon:yes stop_codon:yes gene_type:complete
MNNLKFVALGLFVVFVGLFIFSKVRDDGPVKEASVKREMKVEKRKRPALKKFVAKKPDKVLDNYSPKFYNTEDIKIPETLKEGEFATHKGRLVAELKEGKLIPVRKEWTKKVIYSKEPVHEDLDTRAFKFFKAMGFNSDKKLKVERGKSYFLVSGNTALKVDLFVAKYNWEGKPKVGTYLMKSTSGGYYRKIASDLRLKPPVKDKN